MPGQFMNEDKSDAAYFNPDCSTCGLAFILILCLFFSGANAQNRFQVKGTVKDQLGSPLPGCTIFLNGTKLITIADGSGAFSISGVPPGSYDLVAKMISFKTAVENIVVRSSSIEQGLILQKDSHLLNEVVLKGSSDHTWKNRFEIFKDYFIGTSPNLFQGMMAWKRVADLTPLDLIELKDGTLVLNKN